MTSDKPLNVVVVSTLYPNKIQPTRGIFTANIVANLGGFCRVHVVSPLPWFPKGQIFKRFKKWAIYASLPKHENINGVDVYYPRYLVIPKFFTYLHPLLMFFPLYLLIRRLKQGKKIDVIKTHWIFPDGVAATLVSKILGLPLVLVALGCDITHFPFLPYRRRQIIWALRHAASVLVVSEDLGRRVERLGIPKDKIKLAPDGVDSSKFMLRNREACRQELGISKNSAIVLQVASLDEVKSTKDLVEATAKLKRILDKSVHVYVIGEGHLKGALKKQAHLLGVSNNITFLGRKSHEEVANWMNAVDVFCLTSIREGRPNVLLEAFSSGVPVVATAVGGVPELINDNNGLLAEPGNPMDIANKIKEALDKEWDRNNIAKTVSHLTWGKAGQIYYDVLCQAVIGHKKT